MRFHPDSAKVLYRMLPEEEQYAHWVGIIDVQAPVNSAFSKFYLNMSRIVEIKMEADQTLLLYDRPSEHGLRAYFIDMKLKDFMDSITISQLGK